MRGRGDGPYARLIADRFRRTTERLGLNKVSFELRTDLFHIRRKSNDRTDKAIFSG